MSLVSDNVANANTTAFKSSQARFGDMVSSYVSTLSANTDREGCGSSLLGVSTNFEQGPMLGTDSWSDLAINGDGFFNVQKPGGTENFYTRDGAFHLDKDGYLVNSQEYALLDTSGARIQAEPTPDTPTYKAYSVTADGEVYGTPTGGGDAVLIATVRVCSFPNQDGLVRQGNNLYQPGPTAGDVVDGQANVNGNGSISDMTIEGSNVDLATEMVNMIIYQADYNANSKSVTAGQGMLDTVINMVR